MSYFVEVGNAKNVLDAVTNPETLVKRDPSFADRFNAIQELRSAYDSLYAMTTFAQPGFAGDYKRVASVPHTVLQTAMELEPDLLLNKKKFYAWLDRNPAYCVYTRRKHAV